MKKKIIPLLAFSMTIAFTFSAFAGQWEQDAKGWKYRLDDGSFATGYVNKDGSVDAKWLWIDGNEDGIAEKYAFDGNGYMYVNTVIESFMQKDRVNENGALLQFSSEQPETRQSLKSNKGLWLYDGVRWYHQRSDGEFSSGWEWIDGKCYFFGYYKNPIPYLYEGNVDPDEDEVSINEKGVWVVNGQEVLEGSDLYNKYNMDYFSGSYISTMYEDDGGTTFGNHDRIDIIPYDKEGSIGNRYLVTPYRLQNGQWIEQSNSTVNGAFSQAVDDNGTVFLTNGYSSEKITINGNTLQVTNDEGRVTYTKQ